MFTTSKGRRMCGFNLTTFITWAGSLFLVYLAIFEQSVLTEPMKQGGWPAMLCSFVKFAFLGTLGEIIGLRIVGKRWDIDHWFSRFIVWGFFGIWIGIAIKFYALGAIGTAKANYWWSDGMPFTISLWINFLGGYALFMMVTHDYFNFVIQNNWKNWSVKQFCEELEWHKRIPFLLIVTLVWWLPMHTGTFSADPSLRVQIAAVLSLALGFLLSLKKSQRTNA